MSINCLYYILASCTLEGYNLGQLKEVQVRGGEKVKKCFGLAIIFALVVFLVACGSGGSKKAPVSIGGKQGNSTVQASATKDTGKKLDVAGKECPSNSSKLTSKDLVEAFVLSLCDLKARNELFSSTRLKPSSDGQLEFVSLSQDSVNKDESVNLSFLVKLANCQRCPRDYSGFLSLQKNPAGEWQHGGSSPGSFMETAESYHAAVPRLISAKISATTAQFELDNQYFDLPAKLEIVGGQDPNDLSLVRQVLVQVQFDDGRILEFGSNAEQNWSRFLKTDNSTWKSGSKVKLLAYTLAVSDKSIGDFKPDWIPLEAK